MPVRSLGTVPPCLIVNPLSFRASQGGLAGRAIALARRHGAQVIEAVEPADVFAAMEQLRARRQPRVFVLSGDGTVQGIVQYLALLPAQEWEPELLVLGGGRSNVTARDFGGVPAYAKLEAALRGSSEGRPMGVELHQLLRIEQEGSTPQHGFLLAAAMIDSGIRLCRRHRKSGHGWIHTGPLSDAYTLGRLALQVLTGRSPLPPFPQMRIDAVATPPATGPTTAASQSLQGPIRVLVATTLRHAEGLYNPYAARGEGSVRVTAVAATAPRFWRRLPKILTGRFDEHMDSSQGYLSGRFDHVVLLGLGHYSLDGEAFETDATRPVFIRGGAHLRVLKP